MRKHILYMAALIPALLNAQPRWDLFDHERLTYSLSLGSLGAAEAEFNFARGACDSIHVRIDTKPWTSLLFKIHNHYQTILDPGNGLPCQVQKEINQRNIQQILSMRFDHGQHLAITGDGASWPLGEDALDLFSLLYHIRASLTDSSIRVQYPVHIESHSFQTQGEVKTGGMLSTPVGDMPVKIIELLFIPAQDNRPRTWKTDLLTNRIARPGGKLCIYLGPGPRHLPLQLVFGNEGQQVTMKLKSFYPEER